MSKHEVRVTVAGSAGTGKTTICSIIEKALKDAGIDTVYVGNDTMPKYMTPERHQRCLESIKESSSVKIQEVYGIQRDCIGRL